MSELFSGAYAGTRVLVTGHTGFKGSWLALWLQALGARVTGLALPPDGTPAHWTLLELGDVDHRIVDLRDAGAVQAAVVAADPQVIFHLAAQPLVRHSYHHPIDTFATNVTGLVNLLEATRHCDALRAVVSVTTDKVYRDNGPQGAAYREEDPLGGHDPYSSSKACAEIVTDCYRKSFLQARGVQVATARAGNVIGGGDWSADRLVPDLVRAMLADAPLRLRNPDAIRPWQHVLEPLSGYLRLGERLLAGADVCGPWNFGPSGDATLTVGALAERMRKHWPKLRIELDPAPQPHEAAVLRLDCGKADRSLDWRPLWDAETTIERTLAWYRAFHEKGELRSRDDIGRYVAQARSDGLAWAR